ALVDHGEYEPVSVTLHDIFGNGSGAVRQRGFRTEMRDLDDTDVKQIVDLALQATHATPDPSRSRPWRTTAITT
ncbi:MAG: hypothetical protein KIT69_18575, partial [Propionibacteriaceae bacterium]|nr:hypothetical protein [Propionibacteriaceae bacterium]